MSKGKIGFDHKGIGALLAHSRLAVPVNQREYSWETEHVQTLLEDFNNAISSDHPTYFLGTIVLTGGADAEIPEVADGQQRLATTSILLAAIYDYFIKLNNASRAESIRGYLKTTDLQTEQVVPKLRLNVDDNEFFTRYVLAEPGTPERETEPTKESHKRIQRAAEQCRNFLDTLLSTYKDSNRPQILINWVKFITNDAQVIILSVPDHIDAFEMFETLNDRGLKASQADLVKNYVFGRAGDRLHEAQQRWIQMIGVIESLGLSDLTVTFLRHLMICFEGPTKERELFRKVRQRVSSPQTAIVFLDDAMKGATLYAALHNPEHVYWNDYGQSGRGFVRTLLGLRVEQIKPLMFAVLRKFPPDEAKKAFRLFVSWSVRFLVAGGRGGLLERHYGLRAQEVNIGKIKTAKELAKAMLDVVPPDATFEVAFTEARVSQSFLARYYLRALERHVKDDPEPEYIPNDEESINLEHILPETPAKGWDHISEETASAYFRRLGNMVLLKAKKNVELGNKPFDKKKQTLEQSAYLLTAEAGVKKKWGPDEIAARQARLAALAVKTWPLTL